MIPIQPPQRTSPRSTPFPQEQKNKAIPFSFQQPFTQNLFFLAPNGKKEPAALAALPLDTFTSWESQAPTLLCGEELAYFQQLEFLRRRQSFLLGRIAAKFALQTLTGALPSTIEISQGVFGQPIVHMLSQTPWQVSITHTSSWAIGLAFSLSHPLALDLEEIHPKTSSAVLSYLSLNEKKWTQEDLPRATLLWSAKETLAKLLGSGLATDLSALEVTLPQPISPSTFSIHYQQFSHYQSLGCVTPSRVFCLGFPRKSKLLSPLDLTHFPFLSAFSKLFEMSTR